ncbi:hypothetical protein M413DRAFT_74709 [Hebeloma cylindrosporum]|uniref:F-box domain-containing protein n=1 Tax=Hebeloma cylindrosporum TaxID=76867 RepID=A0A0C2YER3_HEBCY|nr:hypothetical protein M413DRAFT_74709 [Hebeloma cylindrosporum h7]
MLNAPLSFLSDDLVGYLVEHVANLTYWEEALNNLSLADPVFTSFCQKYLFRTLALGGRRGTRSRISKKLTQVKNILDDNPLFANQVRKVELRIEHKQNAWLLQNPSGHDPLRTDAVDALTFISVFRLLANSPMPPHELHLNVAIYPIEDPVLLVGRLSQSFFSQTLTILHLTECQNVPLTLFLICSRLKDVLIDSVEAAKEGYDQYPEDQCFGRESPALERFNYRDSHAIVKQMITPPPRFQTPVVLWSKLRVLTLCPHEANEMALLQPILDAACPTLEELFLTNLHVGPDKQLPLTGLVNLSRLSRLRVFSLYAKIKYDAPGSAVLRDINVVLGTIPVSNCITNLFFDLCILGEREHPLRGCLDEDWEGICNEAIRISFGKPLELDFEIVVSGKFERGRGKKNELYVSIMEKTTSLSDHPNICTHFWNPTYWDHGLGPFPRGQVRGRCRR